MNRLLQIIILLMLYASTANVAVADVPDNQINEVKYLLSFIKESDCIINRNGTDHPANKAVSHIENKYDYFREDIKSTEEFIGLSATRSTMSGDYYTVTCPGKKTIKTGEWLLAELKRFRTETVVCKEPRPQMCTREYNPVCATLSDGTVRTYSTGCTACSDPKVTGYKMGACQ